MRQFGSSGQFKRDVKRMERRGKDLTKLRTVVDMLIEGKSSPERCRDHPLRGEFAGSRDCHVEPDWVLIYTIEGDSVRFERTGSHNDLFR